MSIEKDFIMDYNIDVAVCIDATGDMKIYSDEIKRGVLLMYRKYNDFMSKMDPPKAMSQFRIRVIAFRDFEVDDEPIIQSRFFTLNEEYDALSDFLDSIEFVGGGDAAESGLEALALAIKSDWTDEGSPRQHIIILHTNAAAKLIGSGSDKPAYPADMPKDLDELKDWWDGQYMNQRAKRLFIFSPDVEPWSDMFDWSNAFHFPVQAGFDVDEEYNLLLRLTLCGC